MQTGEDLLLDTDVVIALFRADAGVREALDAARRAYVPAVVAGELLAGALRADRVDAETARVAAFVLSRQVLPCDTGTAYHYAVVKDELRRRGRPIPENDLWIAALARQYGLTLATRDAHYAGIDQLRTDPCRN